MKKNNSQQNIFFVLLPHLLVNLMVPKWAGSKSKRKVSLKEWRWDYWLAQTNWMVRLLARSYHRRCAGNRYGRQSWRRGRKTSGQFNRAESPTLSSRANRLVSMAPLLLTVSLLVKRAVSLAGPLLLVAVLSLAAAATVASSLPLLFDKPTPNPMMSTKMAVPATAHPIRYNFWLGAGWTAG